MNTRHYTWQDNLLIRLQQWVRTIETTTLSPPSTRANPGHPLDEAPLSAAEKTRSAKLMRINHTGEVCAQALYLGQSLTTSNPDLKATFKAAAEEEADHLHWCKTRLKELNSHTSLLNPVWFVGSVFMGAFASALGEKWSLGFLAETEHQVFEHLTQHLNTLPEHDNKSRAILTQMQEDEAKHESTAIHLGAHPLPAPVKFSMRCLAKVMKGVVYYV